MTSTLFAYLLLSEKAARNVPEPAVPTSSIQNAEPLRNIIVVKLIYQHP